MPPSEIQRYYADADIYVQTPAIDNMPLSVLEAFASGLPVVSTRRRRRAGASLRHGVHGLLVADNDDEAMAAQVLRLLDDPAFARQLAAAGSSHAAGVRMARRPRRLAARVSARGRTPARSAGRATCHNRTVESRMILSRLQRAAANDARRMPRGATRELARTAADRVRSAACARRDWDRDDICSRRSRHRSLDDALRTRNRAAVTGAPCTTGLAAAPRDSADRAVCSIRRSADALRERGVDAMADAAADAAARADRILAGHYDLLGYRGLTFARHRRGPEQTEPASTGISIPCTTAARRASSGRTSPTSIPRSATTRSSGSSIVISTGCSSAARCG